ncbi:LacI family DNA-binding transcriptional regulator [Francisella sp. 19X1-34]|uniref:LacI family DNA-binding transcriptional regulator n=1 Tax=Francisella sp. 19X1-34 TaxID=3087177 RepID=UPI002E32AFEC|nr:LacI family DNA-binding transcriptional regulator [Francisella sp. 19X1-34]MED7789203.1 LacI family DNA-binding transcriptional regulator [Francisella sp. 19X1-34]
MATQKDIAKKLNISRTTVSRALMNNGSIKPETKQKVLELAKELGYSKNLIGSSLATKNPKRIYAFIIKSVNNNYCLDIKEGLVNGAKELKNYNVVVNVIETDINTPNEQIKYLKKVVKEEAPDGIIIIPQLKKQIKSIIQENPKIKFITLDIAINNCIPHIGSDYNKSGEISANILAPLIRNDEKVLVLDTKSDEISSSKYLEGFYKEAKAQNLNIVGPVYIDNILDNIDLIIDKYISDDIVAIYSSRYLTEIIHAIKNRLPNIKLFVVSNGMNESICDFLSNKNIFATVKENHARQSYLATKEMFSLLHGDLSKDKNTHQLIEAKIIFRANLN